MTKIQPLTDLAEKLARDSNGDIRDEWIEKAGEWQQSLQKELNSPLNPAQFKEKSAGVEACKATDYIVRMIWSFYHILPGETEGLANSNTKNPAKG